MRCLLLPLALAVAACGQGPHVSLEGVADGGTVSRSADSGKVVFVVPKGANIVFYSNDTPLLAYNRGNGRFEVRLSKLRPGEHTLAAKDHRGLGPTWRIRVVE